MQKKSLTYCAEQLRSADPDRFLISMFAPSNLRADIWALFAFNHEIAKTRAVVSDTTLGLIRLQWWRDAIAKIYEQDQATDHEILKDLRSAIKRHNLPREDFDKLLYAREFDLEDVLPANIEGLLNYADFTTTPLLKLVVQVMGGDPEQEIIQPIAINYTLINIIRSFPHQAREGRFLLPEDLMTRYEINKDTVLNEDKRENLQAAMTELAQAFLPKTKSKNKVLKACEGLTDIYQKQLKSCGYDVCAPAMHTPPPLKVLKLFWKTTIV